MKRLLTSALLGTKQGPPDLQEVAADVLVLNDLLNAATTETKLLGAIAAQSLYTRAGVLPRKATSLLTAAAPDLNPCCTPAAANILERVLQLPGYELLPEWLTLAALAKRRPPPRMLPRLLDLGAAQPTLRHAIEPILDARGTWLAQFHPGWTRSLPAESDADWETGTKPQRLLLLERLRESARARARELIQSTWAADSADERERWVSALSVGLNADDERWLEGCLADRSVKVREAAAELLARLPTSGYVQRMTERAQALLTLAPIKRGLLGRKPAQVEVTLPELFDPAWSQDGLREKPATTIGPKQWWLEQILSRVPPAVWLQHFQLTAEQLVGAAPAEHRDLLLRSWSLAYARNPAAEWTLPLAAARAILPGFLEAVPVEQRPELLGRLTIADAAAQNWVVLNEIRRSWPPLDQGTSRALIERFTAQALLLTDAARWLAPASLDLLEARLTVAGPAGKKLDQALVEIALRREMHQEFQT